MVTHADPRTRAGTHQSHAHGYFWRAGPLSWDAPRFSGRRNAKARISAVLGTQVGASQVTYQGLLPRGPHRERSEPRGCAPSFAWGLRPILQPRSLRPLPGSPHFRGRNGSLRPPAPLPAWRAALNCSHLPEAVCWVGRSGKQSNQKQLPVDVNLFPEKKIVLCSQDKITPRAGLHWKKPGGGGRE